MLVVDDEESVRQALAKILHSFGFHVITADDGQDGINKFEANEIDVVVTDLGLPGLSGWDVAEAVKTKSPGTPVVLLSGWDISEDELRKRGTVARVLMKPVRIQDMVKVIRELTGKTEG